MCEAGFERCVSQSKTCEEAALMPKKPNRHKKPVCKTTFLIVRRFLDESYDEIYEEYAYEESRIRKYVIMQSV